MLLTISLKHVFEKFIIIIIYAYLVYVCMHFIFSHHIFIYNNNNNIPHIITNNNDAKCIKFTSEIHQHCLQIHTKQFQVLVNPKTQKLELTQVG